LRVVTAVAIAVVIIINNNSNQGEKMTQEKTLDDFTIYVMYCQDKNDINFDSMTAKRYIDLVNKGTFHNIKHIVLQEIEVARAVSRMCNE
jgi:hypothetical protein